MAKRGEKGNEVRGRKKGTYTREPQIYYTVLKEQLPNFFVST